MKKSYIGKYYQDPYKAIFQITKVRTCHSTHRFEKVEVEEEIQVAYVKVIHNGLYKPKEIRKNCTHYMLWILNNCTEVSKLKAKLYE